MNGLIFWIALVGCLVALFVLLRSYESEKEKRRKLEVLVRDIIDRFYPDSVENFLRVLAWALKLAEDEMIAPYKESNPEYFNQAAKKRQMPELFLEVGVIFWMR